MRDYTEGDRDRMAREISLDFLLDQLKIAPVYNTTCRFLIHGEPVYCRIRVRRDAPDPGTIVLGIRNIDAEMRFEQTIQTRLFTQQIHPHFLYNALSSIREVVLTDPDFAADLLYDSTTYLRAGIRAIGSSEKIPFARELENVRAYLNIEKVRFADRLTVEYDIRAEEFSVIPFCVQPLVENAVRHGIYEKGAEGGKVRIQTEAAEDGWVIRVEDDGTGFDPQKVFAEIAAGSRDSTGLQNLKFRLETLQAKLEIQSRPGKGTEAVIRIPAAPRE